MRAETRLSERELRYVGRVGLLLDRVVALMDQVSTILSRDLTPATCATSAAELPSLRAKAACSLKEWQELKPPPRFHEAHELYERALLDVAEMLQSTGEALAEGDICALEKERLIALVHYRADLQNMLRAQETLRYHLSQTLPR